MSFPEYGFKFRFGHRPDINFRVELPAQAFDIQQGFLQHQQLWLQGQLEAVCNLEKIEQQFSKRNLVQRPGEIGFTDRSHGRLQFVQAGRFRHPAGIDMQGRDPPVILIEQAP